MDFCGILEKTNQIDKIKKEAEKEIKKVRRNLSKLPQKTSGKCFDASRTIALNLMKKNKDCEFYLQHGEIAHSLSIPSKYWSIQHTWLKIKKNESVLYVDATCDQFGHFLKTEEYYLSTEKNKMFLYDEDNFIYKKKITNSKLIKTIEFLEFEVKGRLFDFVRNLKNNMQVSKKNTKKNTKI